MISSGCKNVYTRWLKAIHKGDGNAVKATCSAQLRIFGTTWFFCERGRKRIRGCWQGQDIGFRNFRRFTFQSPPPLSPLVPVRVQLEYRIVCQLVSPLHSFPFLVRSNRVPLLFVFVFGLIQGDGLRFPRLQRSLLSRRRPSDVRRWDLIAGWFHLFLPFWWIELL